MIEDEIVNIEYVGKKETIDINISGDRLFYVNNILVHNSSVDTQDKNHSHIAGGLSKINVSDVVWAIIRNEDQIDNNEVHLQAMKMRNSEFSSKPVVLRWDASTLRIHDLKINKNAIQNKNKSKPVIRSLSDMLNPKKKVK